MYLSPPPSPYPQLSWLASSVTLGIIPFTTSRAVLRQPGYTSLLTVKQGGEFESERYNIKLFSLL